jgi:hypothetical protein
MHLHHFATGDDMSTTRPRITVTLTEEQHEVISAISRANGQSMSKLIGDLLQEMLPVFRDMRTLMTHVEQVHQEGKASLLESLERSQANLEPLLSGAVGEWKKLADGVLAAAEGSPRPVITGATESQRRGVKQGADRLKPLSDKARRQVVRNKGA